MPVRTAADDLFSHLFDPIASSKSSSDDDPNELKSSSSDESTGACQNFDVIDGEARPLASKLLQMRQRNSAGDSVSSSPSSTTGDFVKVSKVSICDSARSRVNIR